MNDIDKAYKSIGEFVVAFQIIENKYREIGWFIIDPERKNWPPMGLRKETNQKLIDKVTTMFSDLAQSHNFPNGEEKHKDFDNLKEIFHDLRKFRNRILHSVFVEMKEGGKLVSLIRSDPRIIVDSESGELISDKEIFTEAVIHEKLKEVAEATLRLNAHYTQLVHWTPFKRFQKGS